MAHFTTLILLQEAPAKKEDDDVVGNDPASADPGEGGPEEAPPDHPDPVDKPEDEGGDPDATDPNAATVDSASTDDDTLGSMNDDEEGDNLDGSTEAPDTAGEQLRRERLYDTIVDTQSQARRVADSIGIVLGRASDDKMRALLARAKELIEEAERNCTSLQTQFANLGYDRIRDVYATVRERVSAVTELVKHVIDGDDDFRNSDSGTPKKERRPE